jgi:hypothetical protein
LGASGAIGAGFVATCTGWHRSARKTGKRAPAAWSPFAALIGLLWQRCSFVTALHGHWRLGNASSKFGQFDSSGSDVELIV